MQGQQILIKYNTLPFEHPDPLGELLLVNPPETRIANEYLPINKLAILLKVINEVLEELTPEAQLGGPRILLPHQIADPHFQVVIMDAVAPQDHLVQRAQDLDQTVADLFYVGRD